MLVSFFDFGLNEDLFIIFSLVEFYFLRLHGCRWRDRKWVKKISMTIHPHLPYIIKIHLDTTKTTSTLIISHTTSFVRSMFSYFCSSNSNSFHLFSGNELRAVTSTPPPDPALWAFAPENNLLFSTGNDDRVTPADWLVKGPNAMQKNLGF